jgi:hypothetical protein
MPVYPGAFAIHHVIQDRPVPAGHGATRFAVYAHASGATVAGGGTADIDPAAAGVTAHRRYGLAVTAVPQMINTGNVDQRIRPSPFVIEGRLSR